MKKFCIFAMVLLTDGVAHAGIATDAYVTRIVENLESTTNKVDAISVTATATEYPSALAVKNALDTKVSLTGPESVAGVKTFSDSPVIPTPALPASS